MIRAVCQIGKWRRHCLGVRCRIGGKFGPTTLAKQRNLLRIHQFSLKVGPNSATYSSKVDASKRDRYIEHTFVRFKLFRSAMYKAMCTEEYAWKMDNGCDPDLRAISKEICKIEGRFAVDGLAYKGSVTEQHLRLTDGTDFGPLSDLNVCEIEKHARVAPFGRGTETVVDVSVRCAFEIAGDMIDSHVIDAVYGVAKEHFFIHKLFPKNAHRVKASFYKLHMYKKGGFFLSHVDTLHGKNHVGTLVVSLPSPYTGGELCVRTGGHEDELVMRNDGGLSFAAFFTDCEHEVKMVSKGTRIVLQYDLLMDEDGEDDDEDEDDDFDRSTTNDRWFAKGSRVDYRVERGETPMILQAIQKYWKKHPRTGVGVILKQRYVAASLTPELLKGYDLALYDIVKEYGLQITLKSVLIHGVHYADEPVNDTFRAHPFDEEDVIRLVHPELGKERDTLQESSDDVVLLLPSQEAEMACVYHTEYVEFTGNEAAPETNTYFSAALVIYPPRK